MEWVETTGRTIEEAKDAALDQLGIAEDDAEFEVVEEPRTGLFGRTRGEARIRARVRPTSPRPKAERRGQRKRAGGSAKTATPDDGDPSGDAPDVAGGGEDQDPSDPADRNGAQRRRRSRSAGGRSREQGGADERGNGMDDATVEDQAAIIRTFLDGLLGAFQLEATIDEVRVDDDTIELHVNGSELGLLVGPKGQTLQAIHELSRTIVQRKATGTHHGRVRIDVAGYRQRRQVALERFAKEVAADVAASGAAKALEPMHPADRKIVHDTVNEIDGVATTSEGEEPRRRVVISPA
ncbi:MAG: RNA-binding cell elongation regulator Jag/EloR [Acidimicrobiales bacterium]